MNKPFFISVEACKLLFCVETLQIVMNNNTGKISILLPDGTFLKVQQDLDKTKPMAFMTSVMDEFGEPDWFSGCLVNVSKETPLKEFFSI